MEFAGVGENIAEEGTKRPLRKNDSVAVKRGRQRQYIPWVLAQISNQKTKKKSNKYKYYHYDDVVRDGDDDVFRRACGARAHWTFAS